MLALLLASLAAFVFCFGWIGVGASVLIVGHEAITGSRRSRSGGSSLQAIACTLAFYSAVGLVLWVVLVTWVRAGAP